MHIKQIRLSIIIVVITLTNSACILLSDQCSWLIKKGENERALEACTRQIEREKSNSLSGRAYHGRAMLYLQKKQPDQAIDDTNKAIEINPQNENVYNTRGLAFWIKKEYAQAISDFNKALELKPKFDAAFNNRGVVYHTKGQYDHAISDFNKAIELYPKLEIAYRNRGFAYLAKGHSDQAIDDYSKAIKLDPNSELAYNGRGLSYLGQGKYDLALDDFNKSITLNPKIKIAYYTRGIYYRINGRFREALDDFERAIELDTDYEEAYVHLLITKWLSNTDDSETVTDLRKLISSNSTDKWIRTVSKYYLGMDGLDEEAVLTETKKAKEEGELKTQLCQANFFLGMKRLTEGNSEKAAEYFIKSIETDLWNVAEYIEAKAMLNQIRDE